MSITETRMTDKARKKQTLPKLSDRQADVLVFINNHCEQDPLGRSPALKNIAAHFGFTLSMAWQFVQQLKVKGCLTGEPDARWSLKVTEDGFRVVEAWKKHRTN